MLAVAILATAIALLYVLVVAPLGELYADRQTRLENRAMLAARIVVATTELPTLRTRLAELRATPSASNLTLDGATDALAAANLQSRLEALAVSADVPLSSVEALPAEDRGSFRRIGLRITVSGGYENVVRLLGAIENSSPPLVVDNLRIRNEPRPGAQVGYRVDAGFEAYGMRAKDAPVSAAQR